MKTEELKYLLLPILNMYVISIYAHTHTGDHHVLELVTLHREVEELSSIVAEPGSAARGRGRRCLRYGIRNLLRVLLQHTTRAHKHGMS